MNQCERCSGCGADHDRYGPFCSKCLAKLKEKKEPTAAQEREAIVKWLTKRYKNTSYLDVVRIVIKQSAEMIERGEHWPIEEARDVNDR